MICESALQNSRPCFHPSGRVSGTDFTELSDRICPPQRLISVVTLRTQPGKSAVSWLVLNRSTCQPRCSMKLLRALS